MPGSNADLMVRWAYQYLPMRTSMTIDDSLAPEWFYSQSGKRIERSMVVRCPLCSCMAALCSGRWWLSGELEGNLLWENHYWLVLVWNAALILYSVFSALLCSSWWGASMGSLMCAWALCCPWCTCIHLFWHLVITMACKCKTKTTRRSLETQQQIRKFISKPTTANKKKKTQNHQLELKIKRVGLNWTSHACCWLDTVCDSHKEKEKGLHFLNLLPS